MTIAIHQPGYLPWIGFFDKIIQSDIFVLLDNVQFEKNYFDNRNQIKTDQGTKWLTVPILANFGQKLNQVKIDNSKNWRKKHYKTLLYNYGKTPYFQLYEDSLKKIYQEPWNKLIDLNCALIKYICQQLGLDTKLVYASQFNPTEGKTERLLDLCKKLQATKYLSGRFGKKYLDEEKFTENHIAINYQDFQHPVYPQLYNEFTPNLSIIDLLFNCGAKSLDIINNTKKKP